MDFLTLIAPTELGGALTVALLAASFAGSFITIAFGIGGGVMLLAIMASLMPPAALIPVHGVVQLGSNTGRASAMFRHIHWPALGWFGVGALAGVALGSALVVNIPAALVQIGVGVFVIWSVISRPPAWMKRWPVITGALTSFLTMFFGATGPFVATYTRALNLGRHGYAATQASLMVMQHSLKSLAFGFLGFAFAHWVWFCTAMILAGLAGTFTGRLVLDRMTDARFQKFLNAILILIALRLIWSGFHAL
ncbi:sulfite exporter TauE/SafE family protein [Pararhodobacter sp.]|uniref:sulfite exporter TauE/SafE family protein n=1 Tax=Pararhodobacter sp. TaxID=2127056 RepID=UPI002AFE373C|nr:sulfite exporter TauE/SafE family protein [Pararhodobacter sp.]